ncbi:MAG: Fur family transcriptional regulator [Bacteroidales bacterium]
MSTIEIIQQLKKNDIKPSLQRVSVLKYVDNHRNHPTVDEIYNELSPNMPTLSKTTVYNVLKLLYDKHLIQMITIDNKQVHFDADIKHHAHFICKYCGKIIDLDIPECINNINNELLNKNQIQETQVYYKGICKDCLIKHSAKIEKN